MREDVLQRLGLGALEAVKTNPMFPYDTGRLKFNATYVVFVRGNSFAIVFDEVISPYIKYLEDGTSRSQKHVGFISDRATNDVINYLAKQFRLDNDYTVKYKDRQYQTAGFKQKEGKK